MSLRSFFVDHLWLKAFSLVLATLVWLTIHGSLEQETREETKSLDQQPVALLVAPNESRTFEIDPPQVSVMVKGPNAMLEGLREVHAFVEVASHAGNTGNYNVEVLTPAGVTVVQVTPRTVFVKKADVP